MYVCICNNVTQGDIEDAVQKGARTLDCLARQLAVSTCCGQCQYYAHACLQSALEATIPGGIGRFRSSTSDLSLRRPHGSVPIAYGRQRKS